MANRGNQSPLCGVPQHVADVLEGALEGASGGVFPGTVPTLGGDDLAGVDPALLRMPLERILLGALPDLALVFLHATGVLGAVLPEVTAMIDFKDEHARHKDLWTHTVKVVAQVEPRAVLRWAALVHDVGKVKTRSVDGKGKVHFFGHEVAGARMWKRIAVRMAFPGDQSARIRFLVRNHLRAGQYEHDWTDSAVRRFGLGMGETLDDLLALSRADITTRFESKKTRNLRLLDELDDRVRAIRDRDSIPPALPKGLGNALMARFGLKEGPGLGRVMGRLKDLVERGGLPRNASHGEYIRHLEDHPGDLGGCDS